MRPKKKKLIFIIVLLLLCGAVAGGWGWHRHREKTASAPSYKFIPVTRGNIEEAVTAQGKLEPKEYVDVGAQVSGQLQKIHVELGSTVNANDLLAEIDPELQAAEVRANEARRKTLDAQEAEQQALVVQARQKLSRTETLLKAQAISKEAYDDAQTALKTAQAKISSLKAQIEEVQSTLEGNRTNLGYTKIYAPIHGTIVVLDVKEGQTLNANQSAPILMQIANLDVMTVRAQVAEADIMKLKPGMPVYFTTLGARERRWDATVRQILPSPEVVNDVVLYNVLVDVRNEDRQLMTGMSTQMFFVLGKADDVPVVPVAALTRRAAKEDNEQGPAYKIRVRDGKDVAEKIIHTGLMDRVNAQVTAGLEENEEIALPQTEKTEKSSSGGPPRGMGGGPRL